MKKMAILAAALLVVGPARGASSKDAIFDAQAKRIGSLATTAAGLEHCGVRSSAWNVKAQFVIASAIATLARRIYGDDNDALMAAEDRSDDWMNAAEERGKAVGPNWCTQPGLPALVRELDQMVGRSE